MLRRSALSSSSLAQRASRRFFFNDKRLDVVKPVRPPIFEDVVPQVATQLATRKPRVVVSALPPLDALPLAGLEGVAELTPVSERVHASRLANGVRVVSIDAARLGYAVVGVAIESGPRFEREAERGASIVGSRAAFNVSSPRATLSLLVRLVFLFAERQTGSPQNARFRAKVGALNIFSVESREFVAFVGDVPLDEAPRALELIAEQISAPIDDAVAFDETKRGLAVRRRADVITAAARRR